jgi:transcriptional regulator with XRE-family HTH domain
VRSYDEVRAELVTSSDDELAVKEMREQMLEAWRSTQARLGDLRRARDFTQGQLAETLRVSQAQVSRIENQADLYLSTLRSYVEAMGGELSLVATFDDQTVPLRLFAEGAPDTELDEEQGEERSSVRAGRAVRKVPARARKAVRKSASVPAKKRPARKKTAQPAKKRPVRVTGKGTAQPAKKRQRRAAPALRRTAAG